MFGGPGRSKRDAERIYVLKREVLELRRSVAPLQAPLRTLSERPVRLVHPEIREYFRDVEDHLSRVTEQIGSFDELLTTIIQANLAQVTVEQNEDMRRISAVGGDPGDSHCGRRDLRHELPGHAGADVEVRVPVHVGRDRR